MGYPGWLWLQETNGCAIEIINENRTRAYQYLNPNWAGVDSPDCNWAVLDYDPCDLTQITYTTPDDGLNPAPWYTADDPGSASFLGFWLDTVTGLDGAHWGRSVNQRTLGGANVSALRAGGRELAFEVWVAAKNREGLEYGRRWLEYQLAATCDRCQTYKAFVRPFAVDLEGRTEDDIDFEDVAKRGLFALNGVAMTKGPSWSDPPLVGGEAALGRLTFTLVATEPCLVACPVDCLVDATESTWDWTLAADCIPFDQWLCGPTEDFAPVCCEIPASAASVHTSVQFRLDAPSGSSRMSFALRPNPGLACDSPLLDDPCAFMVINGLPAGASVIVDGGNQSILYRELPDSPWVPGDFLVVPLEAESGGFSWPTFDGCGSMWAQVRPYSHCGLYPDMLISISYQLYEGC